jgi:hypothetical protein
MATELELLAQTNQNVSELVSIVKEKDAVIDGKIVELEKKADEKIEELEGWKTEFQGQYLHLEVGSVGLNSAGFRSIKINEQTLLKTGRSYGLVVWDIVNSKLVHAKTYDIYGDVANAKLLSDDINVNLGKGYLFIINTWDEPSHNRLTDELKASMLSLRANMFEDDFGFRSAYMLITLDGKGRLYENLTDFVSSAPLANIYLNTFIGKGEQ